ncbi:MAG TPA: serine/threonine-protein kinase [Gemmatimonadales bacterium]|nr:serine/threonine-protein kinase [Gemmatimonadales bacterium]
MPRPDPRQLAAMGALLDQVLDLDGEVRSSWLADLRGQDPVSAAWLEAVLAREAELEGRGFLEQRSMTALRDALPSLAGTRVGPYTLVAPIGMGGMGSVWRAHRSDGRFEGEVAVKLLNPARIQATSDARFRREGTVLARLTHPNIARLIDAGVTAGGVPYLVLEYVDGVRIDAYADQLRLAPDRRLALVSQVLEAVAHAHAHLVVHRDLKPSNILVTADGTVKLLDFGIAKLLDAHSADGDLTEAGGTPFTPEYAAPEQVIGDAVTVATDVYALGVLLHVLLTGDHPTGGGGDTTARRIRAIVEREPLRLSAAMGSASGRTPAQLAEAAELRSSQAERLRRLYAGDLDNIVARALEKDVQRRYPAATALADDLQRYRRNEPVLARTPSIGYRATKFVRRNRLAVGAAAIVGAALLAATVVTSVQLVAAQEQRDVARAQRDRAVYQEQRATASSGFMDLLLQHITTSDSLAAPVDVLEEARTLLERDFGGDPRFVARMMVELSAHYYRVRDRARQLALLERADKLAAEVGDQETVAHANCWLGMTLAFDGAIGPARERLARAAEALSQLPEQSVDVRIRCLQARSNLARSLGQVDSALVFAGEAMALSTAEGHGGTYQHQFVLNELAGALTTAGRFREALDLTRQSIALLGNVGRGRTMTMLVERYNEAAFLADLGEYTASDSALQATLQLLGDLRGEGGIPTYIATLAGRLAGELGDSDSAVASLQRATANARSQGDVPGQARAAAHLGRQLIRAGRFGEARRELAALEPLLGESERAELLLSEAELAAAEHRAADAVRLFTAYLAANNFPERRPGVRHYPADIGAAAQAALEAGRPEQAESLARRALAIARGEGHDGARSGVVGDGLRVLALAQLALGDSAGALRQLQDALRPMDAAYGAGHPHAVAVRALLDSLATPVPAAAAPGR